jgi:hypothetical protein
MPAFSAYVGTTQNISATTWTKMQFNTENFDTANCFDSTTNYRFTPTVAGYYLISGMAYLNSTGNNPPGGNIGIYKNGSLYIQSTIYVPSPTAQVAGGSTATAVVYLNGTTDYIEFYVYFIAGGSGTYKLDGSSALNYCSGCLIRAA